MFALSALLILCWTAALLILLREERRLSFWGKSSNNLSFCGKSWHEPAKLILLREELGYCWYDAIQDGKDCYDAKLTISHASAGKLQPTFGCHRSVQANREGTGCHLTPALSLYNQRKRQHCLSFCGKSAAYPFEGRAAITYPFEEELERDSRAYPFVGRVWLIRLYSLSQESG